MKNGKEVMPHDSVEVQCFASQERTNVIRKKSMHKRQSEEKYDEIGDISPFLIEKRTVFNKIKHITSENHAA